MTRKCRGRILAVIALAVGLCVLAAGIAGKMEMERITDEVMSANYFGFLGNGSSGLIRTLNRFIGKHLLRLTVALIKNDPSGFVRIAKDISGILSAIPGVSGLVDLFLGSFIEDAALDMFQKARQMMLDSAGARMPLMQFAACYSELLWIGGILSGAALVLCLLTGEKRSFRRTSRGRAPVMTWDSGTAVCDEW